MDDRWIWLKVALVASSLSTLDVFFCHRKFFVSFADFYQPPTSFPSLPPPFIPYCLTLSQMVNLYGLLVKSTSPDVFHLETGLEDPPLQFPPPPPPPLYPLPCLFPLLPDGSSQRRWDADCVVFRSLMSLTLGNCCLLRFFSSFILLSYSNVLLQTLHS